jgi:hypothetical protein
MKFKPTTVRMHDNIIMCDTVDKCSIKVFNAITGQKVTAIQDLNMKSSKSISCLSKINEIVRDGWRFSDFDFGYRGLVAAFSYPIDKSEQYGVTFWRMNSPRDITFLHHCPLPDFKCRCLSIFMDDHYVAVSINLKDNDWKLLYLISTKTLSIENSLQFEQDIYVGWSYQQGRLILFSDETMK